MIKEKIKKGKEDKGYWKELKIMQIFEVNKWEEAH